MLVKTINGFEIHFNALPEYEPLNGLFPDDTPAQIKELSDKINSYELIYFCAQVTAKKNGIELASDYLGGCIYKSEQDFIESGDYFDDMCETAIKESKDIIRSLCNA